MITRRQLDLRAIRIDLVVQLVIEPFEGGIPPEFGLLELREQRPDVVQAVGFHG